MSRVVALIQARMGSTRFPGKMLANLGGYPILEWVVQRVSHAQLIDKVVLATTDLPRDDQLVALADQLGVEVFRGSEADVLGRFATAAAQHEADLVVRICADNPFIDAHEIDRLVAHFKKTSCDYACNHQERLGNCYADGFGAEILTNSLLQRVSQVATEHKHREHATSYIWDHASELHIEAVPAPRELAYPELRFDVDTAKDLARLQELVAAGVGIDTAAPVITNIALGNDRALLVTTDVKKSPVNVRNTYFLGAWCFSSRQDERLAREAGRIIPYHWNDRNKLKRDFERLQDLNDELIEELIPVLNKLHGVNEHGEFWKLLLGYWLNVYTAVVFDRWSSISQAMKQEKHWRTEALLVCDQLLASNDTEAFIQAATESSRWNDALFTLLIGYVPEIETSCIAVQKPIAEAPNSVRRNQSSFKIIIKKTFRALAKRVKLKDRFFLISTYLPTKELLKLEVALKQFPLPRFAFQCKLSIDFDSVFRQWIIPAKPKADKFEVVVRDLLPKLLPRIFLEGFSDLIRAADEQPWPKFPEVVFTSNAHFTDDVFKTWAAKRKSEGARLVIGEHGGFGVGLFNGAHKYELLIADAYLSTGWTDPRNINVLPIGNFRIAGQTSRPKRNGKALMVCVNMPRFSFDIRSMALSSQILDYHEDQFSLIDSLPFDLRDQIVVRLYPSDYGWEQRARWLDRHPSVIFDDSSSSIMRSMLSCRLFIGTYAATTYIDALALNFPTVIFWDGRLWEVKSEAQPYFEALKKAGIFHESPISAANHISKVWDDISGWWESDAVQKARRDFCDAYSSTPNDLIGVLQNALLLEATRSSMFRTQ